jgi:hypothetical protein
MASQLYQPEWRDRSIIASKPTEEIAAFIKWTITYYKEKHWKDYDLWEGFLDDYCSFTLETFWNYDINTIKDIREHLRQNGVYVQKSRGIEVAKILFKLLQENEPAKWPANDLPQAITPATTAPAAATPTITTPAIQSTSTTPASTTPAVFATHRQDTLSQIDNITEETSQLNLQPQPIVTQDYSRQIATLSKLYTDEMKYSGQKDNFDFKFEVFQTYCVQAGLPPPAYAIAINIMLKDQALKYYFTHLKSEPVESVCVGLKSNFEGDEYKRDILDEWNSIKLTDSTEKALEALLDCMWHLQRGLHMDLQNDTMFYNKLLTACRKIPACKPAVYRPAPTLTGLISDLRSAITTYGTEMTDAFYTDRRYHKTGESRGGKGKCFVCGKKGCWSTNHPKDERSWRIRQYITEYEAGDGANISDSEKPTGSETWTATIDWEPDKGRPPSTSTFFNYHNEESTLEAEADKGEDLFREDEGLLPKAYYCMIWD